MMPVRVRDPRELTVSATSSDEQVSAWWCRIVRVPVPDHRGAMDRHSLACNRACEAVLDLHVCNRWCRARDVANDEEVGAYYLIEVGI